MTRPAPLPAPPFIGTVGTPEAPPTVDPQAQHLPQTPLAGPPALAPVGAAAMPATVGGPPSLATIGSVPAPAAPSALSAPPTLATVGGAPTAPPAAQPVAGPSGIPPAANFAPPVAFTSPIKMYEPPAAAWANPPEIPGKWKPEYTKDGNEYVVPGLDGIRKTDNVTRATTLAKSLDDSTNLTNWMLRGTVLGLANNPHLLNGIDTTAHPHIATLEFFDRKSLERIANKAKRSVGGDDGSVFGNKLHAWLEAIIAGATTFDQAPKDLQPYLAVLFESMRRLGFQFVDKMVERTVFIPASGLVGTFDFLAVTPDGDWVIGDLKTSSSIDWSWLSIAIQLAQYSTATMMLSWDGSRWEVMPPVSRVFALVLSVPKDEPIPTCTPYVVDLNLGSEMMETALRVQHLHAVAKRAASDSTALREGDELLAWTAGAEVNLRELVGQTPPAA
ncbi:Uncharacterised protein (plasmid) [Tsukamurella tyrosinosolvens]|uniref:PD-(D/E)XK nuclease superfamily protein n=1 Tax=Tsukamurella tyrosinosolvens TaxID=57704 RepID=A0A1H4VT67_TSUTY|nr:hypothetical protein [Tsukamurella tyrosinosolvens]KXO90903.1 hypothetical protein AXK58_20945 [Tsukamurella tyrosinosolvens]SEC83611.1 hypothetical protein SAMN04489793_3313 [Tsukamurella tyrosinosolvens]VEH90346.1 Uncharacterised protein [Tsukamurella tyrosinosolvens]